MSTSNPKPEYVTGYPAAAGVAYPYPAPTAGYPGGGGGGYPPYPPPPPPTAGYYPNPNRTPLLRRLVSLAIGVFLILGVVTLTMYLILRPRVPEFTVSAFSVSNLTISPSSTLSADFNLTFTVRNPNKKMTVQYERLTAGVLYDLESITETAVAPLFQGKREVSDLNVRMVAAEEYVGDMAGRIRGDVDAGKGVGFQVKVVGFALFRSGGWRTRRHVIRVFCGDVDVGVRNSTGKGVLLGQPRPCRVSL